MNYSTVNQGTVSRNYLPDSVYMLCGEDTQACNVCSNEVWSPVVNGLVHDTQRGKVFCPFGMGDSQNRTIYGDQSYIIHNNPSQFEQTTWGRVPQLSPRPLAKIGLEFRTA